MYATQRILHMMSPYTTSNKLLTVQKRDINILPHRTNPLKPAVNLIYLKTYFPTSLKTMRLHYNDSLMQWFSKWGVGESVPGIPRKDDKKKQASSIYDSTYA
jgi:hypothetical protein